MKNFLIKLLFSFAFVNPTETISTTNSLDNLKFNVYRNDSLIGYHKIDFLSDENIITAKIKIKFEVKFLGFIIYDYFHENTEVWEKNSFKLWIDMSFLSI